MKAAHELACGIIARAERFAAVQDSGSAMFIARASGKAPRTSTVSGPGKRYLTILPRSNRSLIELFQIGPCSPAISTQYPHIEGPATSFEYSVFRSSVLTNVKYARSLVPALIFFRYRWQYSEGGEGSRQPGTWVPTVLGGEAVQVASTSTGVQGF